MRTKLVVLCLSLLALAVAVSATPAAKPAAPAPAATVAAPAPAPAQLPAFLAAGPTTASSFTSCCSQAEKLACYHYGLIWTCDTGFCSCTAP